jgi:NAD(P) transhydrogenase subunit beta
VTQPALWVGAVLALVGLLLGVLLVAGPLVGASGAFLTKLVASAMGRSVANILFGALRGGSTLGAGVASDRPVRSAGPQDVAILLGYASRVIIVPGYGLAVVTVTSPGTAVGTVLALVGLLLGVLLVLPVGGADVPIVISLLNAFTGLTVAAGGYVLGNAVLLVAGTLVGASGTFLTKLMAAAMGRSVVNILFGALKGGSTLGAGVASDRPVRSAHPEDVAILLGYAHKVIIVPGYGLAVAQAQHTLRELVDELTERGITVDYAIHPVAGRMPGHMNVLLAEAQVPYEQLVEMDDINSQFKQTDVVLVVGANDVVNPAAKTTPGAPIYGMPILNADEAQQIVFLKRSMRPGFAGIENELLFDPKTTLLFGDAKASLGKLLSAVKSL